MTEDDCTRLADKTAIYQPSNHYPTTRYTPAGRYGGFFLID